MGLVCRARIRMLRPKLSRREFQVAQCIGKGWHTPEIASELGIAQRTVKQYLRLAYKKLHFQKPGRGRRLKLMLAWNCELFQIGLEELKLVPRNELRRAA